MIAENPLALAYILPDDVYMLPHEKPSSAELQQATEPSASVNTPELSTITLAEEPAVAYTEPAPVEQPAVQSPAIPQITPPVLTETQAVTLNYLGGYQKKFLIVVHYPNHDIMEPAHLNALESTIKRRELSLNEVAIFNIGKYPEVDLKAIGKFFKPQKMLLLGKSALPPGLDMPPLNLVTKLGKCDMLYSFSFTEMMGNKENTKAFWEQMKML